MNTDEKFSITRGVYFFGVQIKLGFKKVAERRNELSHYTLKKIMKCLHEFSALIYFN